MKNMKVLLIIIVVAMALMGVGYASWTDEVVINMKVTTAIVEEETEVNINIFKKEVISEKNLSADIDENGTTITMDNLKQGGYAQFRIVFKNEEDILKQLDEIKITLKNNIDLGEYITIESGFAPGNNNDSDIELVADWNDVAVSDHIFNSNNNKFLTWNFKIKLNENISEELLNHSLLFNIDYKFKLAK